MLLVAIKSCLLAPANSLLCITGKRGFCIIQPSSCASSLVPSSPARGTWQLQSDWELPRFKIKAQVCETTLWKQQHASDTGHISSLCLWRGIEGKMLKSHLPLLEVIYLKKIPSNQWPREDYRVFYLLVAEKEKTQFLTVSLKFYCSIFLLLLLTLLSSWPIPAYANSDFCSMSSP